MPLAKKTLLAIIEVPLRLFLLIVGGVLGWLGVMAFLSMGPEDSIGPSTGGIGLCLVLSGFALSAGVSSRPFWRNDSLKSFFLLFLLVVVIFVCFVGTILLAAWVTSLLIDRESHFHGCAVFLVLVACSTLEYGLFLALRWAALQVPICHARRRGVLQSSRECETKDAWMVQRNPPSND